MKISEFVDALNSIKDRSGDLDVYLDLGEDQKKAVCYDEIRPSYIEINPLFVIIG